MFAHPLRLRLAFSLVELLVVIAILAVLLGLLVPAIWKIRAAGDRAACQNNLRQLGVAIHHYHDEFGRMPQYVGNERGTAASWFYYLMPFIGEQPPPRSRLHGSLVGDTASFPVLACAADPTAGQEPSMSKTNYLGNWYAFTNVPKGCFAPPQSFASLTNGLSNVVLFGECYSVCNKTTRLAMESPYYHNFGITQEDLPSDDPKYRPKEYTMFQVQPGVGPPPHGCDPWRTQTPHTVMHAGIADGSVRSILPGIDPLVWKKALKPRTGDLPGW